MVVEKPQAGTRAGKGGRLGTVCGVRQRNQAQGGEGGVTIKSYAAQTTQWGNKYMKGGGELYNQPGKGNHNTHEPSQNNGEEGNQIEGQCKPNQRWGQKVWGRGKGGKARGGGKAHGGGAVGVGNLANGKGAMSKGAGGKGGGKGEGGSVGEGEGWGVWGSGNRQGRRVGYNCKPGVGVNT